MHIRNSLVTKFYFKQTILSFGAKFAQKRVFPVKNGKSEHINKFCIIELV